MRCSMVRKANPSRGVRKSLPDVHARTTYSCNHASDNQSVRTWSGSAKCAAGFKGDNRGYDEPLDLESPIELADEQDDRDGAHGKADADPGQLLDLAEVFVDRSLYVCGDGGVET